MTGLPTTGASTSTSDGTGTSGESSGGSSESSTSSSGSTSSDSGGSGESSEASSGESSSSSSGSDTGAVSATEGSGSESSSAGEESGTGTTGTGSTSGGTSSTTGVDPCAGFSDIVFDFTADDGWTSDVANASSAGNSWRRGDVPPNGTGTNRPSETRTGVWSTGLVTDEASASSLYLADESSYVASGPIDLSDCPTGPITMKLEHWFLFESPTGSTAEAGGIVQLSDDDGTTWETIAPGSGSRYGTKVIASSYDPPAGELGFIDDTSDMWVESTFDLGAWAGEEIRIRFVFGSSNSSGRRAGWYVENLAITNP